MEEDDLSKRVDAILKKFEDHLGKEDDSSTNAQQQQDLIARLINALPYLERLKNSHVNVGQAEVVTATLLTQHPQVELAEKIIGKLEKRICIYRSVFLSVWEGRSAAAQLLLGVVSHVLLLFIVALVVLFCPTLKGLFGNIEPIMVWVLVGGALGGITSLLVRLHDFAVVARWSPEADPKVLFFTGLVKPVVGIVFALFIWSAFSSDLLSLNLPSAAATNPKLYFALSFIAGFSERFAPDLANRAPPMER